MLNDFAALPTRSKIAVFLFIGLWPSIVSAQSTSLGNELEVIFDDSDSYEFNQREKSLIMGIVEKSETEVRALMPKLPTGFQVTVLPIDRELDGVGGVTGRADSPSDVVIYLSTAFENGIKSSATTGLAATLFHEFHHLVRGWTISENKFAPGITIAAVNEGLANVFSETYTNTAFTGNAYPANVEAWFMEIQQLPTDADYGHWMNLHPDGRESIGYKVGGYLVRRAMETSKLSILELSELSIEEILAYVAD
ncbi:MAG: hypothetical protein ISP88_09965 [Pseudomonadales bacterium]|nr:hypothetical protein [Pseudomonadales bacterium]